jgi:hypothetical protein
MLDSYEIAMPGAALKVWAVRGIMPIAAGGRVVTLWEVILEAEATQHPAISHTQVNGNICRCAHGPPLSFTRQVVFQVYRDA